MTAALTALLPARLQPYAKAALPFLATLAAIAVQWIATGEYDRAELTTTITGLGTTLLAFAVPNLPPAAHDAKPDPSTMSGGRTVDRAADA